MAKFEFAKSNLLPLLAKYDFDDIDEAAYVKVLLTIEILIFNLLNNILYITKSLKVKTIKKTHCLAVLQIMKDYETGKEVMKGGGPVLPMEYYGHDSGSYFDADVVSAIENQPWSDPGLTRTALDTSFGGARRKTNVETSFITKNQIKMIIEKYKESEKESFKVSKEVYDVILSCVMANIDALFLACSKANKKRLTMTLLYSTLKKNPKQFAHVSYIFK